MTEIVNLRRVRKAKARQAAENAAEAKRAASGRRKSERLAAQSQNERAQRELEGHRREIGPRDEPTHGDE